MNYALLITCNHDVELTTPKWFTGLMLERWPEYLADKTRAAVMPREQALLMRSAFTERRITSVLVAA